LLTRGACLQIQMTRLCRDYILACAINLIARY